jgi:hypothetical protein
MVFATGVEIGVYCVVPGWAPKQMKPFELALNWVKLVLLNLKVKLIFISPDTASSCPEAIIGVPPVIAV